MNQKKESIDEISMDSFVYFRKENTMEKLITKFNNVEYISFEKVDNIHTNILYRFKSKTGNINEYEIKKVCVETNCPELQNLKNKLRQSSFYQLPIEYGFPVDKREWINTKYINAKINKSVLVLYSNGENEIINDINIDSILAAKICKYNSTLANQIRKIIYSD